MFNYNFDKFRNNKKRLDKLCETVKPYMNMEPSTLKHSIKLSIKDKIEYNYNLYCEKFNVEQSREI